MNDWNDYPDDLLDAAQFEIELAEGIESYRQEEGMFDDEVME